MTSDSASAESGLPHKIVRAIITVVLILVIPGLIGAVIGVPLASGRRC